MNYLKKTGKWMCAVYLLAGTPMIPHTTQASELQTCFLSVQMETTTLKELFDLIEEKFSYSFLIRNNDLNLNERVSVKTENRSVEEILKSALKNQRADFLVSDHKIIVYKNTSKQEIDTFVAKMKMQQKTIKVKGSVVDGTTGEPIISANVIVKGTLNGTSTDLDGRFEMEVPENAILEVSYIGYLKSEIKVQAGTMTIKIKEDTQALEEVVVVGYGVQKKESLTGAMQVVSSEKLTDATTPSVENLLSGKAPGVYVNAGGGQPGAAGKVVIRGKSTVNGSTDPLWIIDGVIVGSDAGSLNPADIESMSILKDAASTAIYGSQGANGVIVVTTKKGKTGDAVINVSAKLGVSQLHKGNLEMMDGAELYDYYKSFANQEAITFPRWGEDLRNQNYDWWKNGTQLGVAQDYNISISGGSEKIKTYASIGIYDEEGAVKGYDYTRYNLRFNVDYQATNWLTIKPKFWGTRKDIMDNQHSMGALYENMPWDFPYDQDGKLIQQIKPDNWVSTDHTNYQYDLQWNYDKTTSYELMANFDFDVKLTDWLTFASVNNYKYGNTALKSYKDPRSSSGQSENGVLQDKTTSYYRVYSNQLLRFNKLFGKHAVNAILAYEWNTFTEEVKDQTGTGFAPGFTVADVAIVPKSVKGSQNEWAVQSYLFNANYSYDSRYLASVSFRQDGASNFGDNAKYGKFFSVSGGWNIHQESFFDAKDWVQQLKLRASYGSVGNRPTELYPQYALYSMGTGYAGKPGAIISQVKNDDLTWEKTFTTGVGVDAILFDRLTVNLDYYNKKTTDLLYFVPLPGVTGVTGVFRNVGAVKNNGFEASVSVDVLKEGDWRWNVAANMGINRNKVTELYGEKDEIITTNADAGLMGVADKIVKPGEDVDTWYTTEWAGVNADTGAPEWYTTDADGNRVKTSNYSDASKHQVVSGKSTPDFYGGFSTELTWKNFDLSAIFGYSVGGKIYNYSRSVFDSDGAYTSYNQQKLLDSWSRWEKPGDIATHPKAEYGNKSQSCKTSSRYLEDAGYLRLRNLSLGYNVPMKWNYISRLRVFASAENLFVIAGFSGIDPELPASTRTGKAGVSSSPYPQTRKFMFGVNVSF